MSTIYYERSDTFDPEKNLSHEEELLKTVRKGTVFMLWQNAPCVVLGKNQIPEEEVDSDYADAHGITVLKRTTGGGAVYHDPGNVNFTLIQDYSPNQPVSLSALTMPVIHAIRELGIDAEFSGRNDILVNGRKVCGTAFRIDRDRILAHGCIDFSVDTDVMTRVLTPNTEKLERHGIRSVRSRVLPLSSLLPEMSIEEFITHLETSILNELERTSL